jgi:hypothetical protein
MEAHSTCIQSLDTTFFCEWILDHLYIHIHMTSWDGMQRYWTIIHTYTYDIMGWNANCTNVCFHSSVLSIQINYSSKLSSSCCCCCCPSPSSWLAIVEWVLYLVSQIVNCPPPPFASSSPCSSSSSSSSQSDALSSLLPRKMQNQIRKTATATLKCFLGD